MHSALYSGPNAFTPSGGADPTAKLNGDWMFYIRMLEAGDIVYTPEIINYFRLHAVTQRQRANANGKVYRELLAIVDYIPWCAPPGALDRSESLPKCSRLVDPLPLPPNMARAGPAGEHCGELGIV